MTTVLSLNEVAHQANLRKANTAIKTGASATLEQAIKNQPERKQAGTTYQNEKVIVAREAQLGGGPEGKANRFSIQEGAESVLIDTVEDFVHHLDNPVLTATLAPWQRNFIAEFKKQFGGEAGDGVAYDPAQLHEYATQYVRRTDGSGLVGALKIAEWKVAMYQQATGAHVVEHQGFKETFGPRMHSAGLVGEQAVSQEQKVKQRLWGWLPDKKTVVPTKVARTLEAEEKARNNAPVDQRDRNYDFDVDYPNPATGAITYSPNGLDAGQIAYLRSVGIDVAPATGGTPPTTPARSVTMTDGAGSGARYASAEKNRLRDIICGLTEARVVVYRSLGKNNIELNLVSGGTYITEPQRFLQIEHKAGTATPTNVEAAIVRQLEAATEDMKKQNKETAKKAKEGAKEAKKQAETDRTLRLIVDKRDELAKGPPELSEADKQKIEANKKANGEDEQKKTELAQTIQLGKELADLKKKADEAAAKVPANQKTLREGLSPTGKAKAGSIVEAELAKEQEDEKVEAAKRKLENAQQRQRAASEAFNRLRKDSPNELVVAARDEFTATRDISAEQTAYDTAVSAQKKAEAELQKRQRLKAQYDTEWNAREQAQQAFDDAVKAYTEGAAKYTVAGTSAADLYGVTGLRVQESDLKAAIDAAEADIKRRNEENTKLEDPDKIPREHKLGVYQELVDALTPANKVEAIDVRISELKDKKKEELKVAGAYDQYPPVYLRALQVMFGWDITDFSRAEDFKKATLMMSPDVFFSTIDTSVITVPNPSAPPPTIVVTDPYDDALRTPAVMKKLSGPMMTKFTNTLIEEASKGNLGTLTPAEIAGREDFQHRTPHDIFAAPITPADRNTLVNEIAHTYYYFDNEDHLANLIWSRYNGYGGSVGGGTAIIATQEHAKAFAREIIRQRNI